MAARSLGRFGREDAVGPLVELARTEPPTSKVRGSLAYSLERLGVAEEVGGDRRIHPYVYFGLGLLLFVAGVWLAQAPDAGTPGVLVAVVGIAFLLVGRVQVIRHSHDRHLWVFDPSGGDPVWIAAGISGDGGGWGEMGGLTVAEVGTAAVEVDRTSCRSLHVQCSRGEPYRAPCPSPFRRRPRRSHTT